MGERFHGEAAIQIQRLRKTFEDNNVLKNISFVVEADTIHGLVGLSGAGKTTLLNCLVGYYDYDGGNVLINGEKPDQEAARNIGFTTQESCFYEDITVKDNIRYFGDLYSLNRTQLFDRAGTLLRLTGLKNTKNTKAGKLSGGMQRRFDLVLSLLHNPDILILDEPASGLDPKRRHKIWQLIQRINQTGVTTIVSSHLLNDLEDLCTQISLLHKGTIVSTDTPERLRDLFSHHFRLRLRTKPGHYSSLLNTLKEEVPETSNERTKNDELLVGIDDPEYAIRILPTILDRADETIVDISIEKPGLESLMEKVS